MTSLAHSSRWELVPYDPEVASSLEAACGVTPLVARIMAGRGISTASEAARFLQPSLDRDWEDPTLICGLVAVVDRLERALEADGR